MKALKWIGIVVGGVVVILFLALLLIPMFVDVNQYKPKIESKVAEATGRDFEIGGDLKLSLFPWAGVSFTDLRMGNPKGFEEENFVSIKAFDVQMKLLPLLTKNIQIKRFVVERPRIVLIKSKGGQGNWEGLGGPSGEHETRETKRRTHKKEPGEGLPIQSLVIGECAIRNGSVLWVDQAKGERTELSDLTVQLEDVSFEKPIRIVLSALLDKKPLSLEGRLGPLGKEPGKGPLPLNLVVKALDQLDVKLEGKVVDPAIKPQFDLTLQVSPFSPRKLMAALTQPFPVETADPKALDKVALKMNLKGDTANVSIREGALNLDESKLEFSFRAKDFEKPDLAFKLNLDQIDVDRYLPPQKEKGDEKDEKKPKEEKVKKKTDYEPLRRLVLDGTVRIGKVKVKNIRIQDLHLKVVGKDGRFNLKPCDLKLYDGKVSLEGVTDVKQDVPKNNFKLLADGIQAGPFLKDFINKDFIEGTTKADVAIRMKGDDPDHIKATLNGKGELLFEDGAVKGIDLAGMIRNVKTAFGLAEKGDQKPRTDFSEFRAPFTIKNGVIDTRNTQMKSPLIRVLAKGKTNLVNETLAMRIEPKFVATIKGQGDTKDRAGLTVPVNVTGTFASPKFRPDLKAMLEENLLKGIQKPKDLKKLLPLEKTDKEGTKPVEETVKGLIKSLPFGQ